MDSYVNFQDDAYYPADQFRRMIGRTQDNATGFDGIDSFKPTNTAGLTWAVEVARGRALVSDNAGGTYWVEKTTSSTVPTHGIVDGYVVLVVLDKKAGDTSNAMTLDVIKTTDPIPARSLLICKFHDTGAGIRIDEDSRYTTAGQFVVSPSGPARFGPPTGTMGLGQFSPGSQYTDLVAGVRWIKDQNGNWVRSDAGAGSIDSVNGNHGPNVVLTAPDVGAVPDVIPRVTNNNKDLATDTAKWNGFSGGGYTTITGAGGISTNVEAIVKDLRLGTGGSLAGGSGGVIGFPNAAVAPTGSPSGAVMWAQGGKLYFKNATGAASVVGQSSSGVDVKSFGAIGDGVADDAPAIQAALNAVRDAGGGMVTVPYGTYKLTTLPLRIYKNTHLRLINGATLVRGDVIKTMIVNGVADASGYNGQGNIIIEGGIWDMRGTGLTSPANCISIGHATNVIIRDAQFKDIPGYHGIEFNATHTAIVENCRFEGYTDTGGRDFSEAIQIDLAKGSGQFGSFGVYDSTPCVFVSVTNCYFGAGWPRGVGSHSTVNGKTHKNINIEGNYFYTLKQMAISSYNWDNVTIANNTIDFCGAGIRIKNINGSVPADTQDSTGTVTNRSMSNYGITITGNTIRSTGTYAPAIRVAGDTDVDGTQRWINYVTISGNTINTTDGTGDSGVGIQLEYVWGATVSGNSIASTGGSGIQAVYGGNIVIANNIISAPNNYGILDRMINMSKVHGNIVKGAAAYGISVSGGSYAMVTDNFIRDCTTYGIRVAGYDPDGAGPAPASAVNDVVTVGNSVSGSYTVGISIAATTGYSRRYGNDCRSSTIEDWSDTIRSNPKDTNSVVGKD